MNQTTKLIFMSLLAGAFCTTLPAQPAGQQPPPSVGTDTPPFGTNQAPVLGTNAPPVWGTNAPPVSTNQPPTISTNGPPVWGTNAPPTSTNQPPTISTNAATDLAARAAVAYAALVPYDTAGDGTLNASEQAVLAEALTKGAVPIFGTNTFIVPSSDAAKVAAWLAALYSVLATFDVDHNGVLEATEQAALATALEDDTVSLALFAPLLFNETNPSDPKQTNSGLPNARNTSTRVR
jgi:hypothetical protein